MPKEVSAYVVDSYVRLRKVSKDDEEQNKSHTYTSTRTLLGILRISQALARLRCGDVVEHADVDEALRLMECSKESLLDDEDREVETDKSTQSRIFRLIKEMASGNQGKRPKAPKRLGRGPGGERDMDVDESDDDDTNVVTMVDIRSRILAAGYTEAQLMETISQVRGCPMTLVVHDILITFFFSTKTSMFSSALQVDQRFSSTDTFRIVLSSLFVLYTSASIYRLKELTSACGRLYCRIFPMFDVCQCHFVVSGRKCDMLQHKNPMAL